MNYVRFPPSLSELVAKTNTISGWDLLQREGIDRGNGPLECT